MTNTEIIQAIKAEIERLYGKYEPKYHETRLPYVEGLLDGFDLIEQFLDTLESEKPMEQDGLKEEIESYWKENGPMSHAEYDRLAKCASYFAEWGAEHLAGVRKMIEPEKKEGRTDCSPQGKVPNDSLVTQSYENIPKDLEEAAEKYLDELFGKGKHQQFYKELFIAGAKWALNQGVKATGTISPRGIIYDNNVGYHLFLERYHYGDKVEVQIRKIE